MTAVDEQGDALPSSAAIRTESVLPLHHQVYNALHQKILDGIYSDGNPMPGELRIVEDFGVSRTTVRRALERLRKEGLISRQQGLGTFTTAKPSLDRQHSLGMPYTEYVKTASAAYSCTVLDFSFVPTPHLLDARPDRFGPVVLKVVRLCFAAKIPVHLSTSYIPQRLGQTVDRNGLGSQPLVSLLRSSGIVVESADLSIEAVAADERESELLQVAIGAPILRGTHISLGKNNQPLECNVVVSKPERFRYRFISDENTAVMRPVFGLG